MKKNNPVYIRIFKFIIIILLAGQAAFPLYTIIKSELALNSGAEYKFLVRPADPYDPFRGRYVTLRYENNMATATEVLKKNELADGLLFVDKEGFAYVKELSKYKTALYSNLVVTVRITGDISKIGNAHFEFLNNKLFMNEKIAPKVDRVMRAYRGKIYVKASVKNGDMILKGLYFDGVEASEYVKKEVK